MTGFEEEGVRRQYQCETVSQAVRTFERSCEMCCCRGYNTPCERCAIAAAHDEVCRTIRDAAEERRQKAREAYKRQVSYTPQTVISVRVWI